MKALAAASAAAGDVFLGLLQTILAIMVPNGAGIELGVQVDEDGDPVVVCTHGSGHNVFCKPKFCDVCDEFLQGGWPRLAVQKR